MTPQPPDPIMQPELWRVWISGYEAGHAAGILRGRAEVVAAVLPAAESIAATQPHRGIPHEELVRRRAAAAAAAPSLTPEEIRTRAHESWGLPMSSTSTAPREPRTRETGAPQPGTRGPGAGRRSSSEEPMAGRGERPEHRRGYRATAATRAARGIGR